MHFGSACSELLVGDLTEILVWAFSLFRSHFVLVLHILVENGACFRSEGFEIMCYFDLFCAEVITCGDGGSDGDATGGHCHAASRFYSSQQGRSGVQLQREGACEPATEFSCVAECAAGARD